MRANHAPRLRVVASAAALGLLLGAGTGAAASAAPGDPGRGRYIPGAEGIGDPYFPFAGNGGIDVLHYDLDLDYTPPANPEVLEGELAGTATLRLRATADLRSFNLDLRGLDATGVTVDGKPARQTQQDGELRITPRPKLRSGETVDVVITYGGTTTRPRDIEGALYGWVTTADGAMVVSEPDGASTWFPVNDHPSDKASYAFEITVPDGLVAVANGDLVGSDTEDERTTWTWDAPAPMAAYLATATVGNFELQASTAPDGTPILDAVDADLDPSRYADLALTGEMMAYFTSQFGAYPFGSYGAIVDDDSVGYALETQTRSFFSRSAREGTVAHELAHQWYGDSVSPERWADIWLNEGWAVYATWMWFDHRGEQSVQEAYEEVLAIPADDPFWDVVVSDPGPTGLFAGAIYDRGAATLQALRLEIGDEAFFTVAREWVARYGGGSASTDDFRALAEEVSGQDLDERFETWLDTPSKPSAGG